MIAIDTNVLVRLFVNDDATPAKKAKALFDVHANENGALWIADIVLVKLVWALDRSYGRSRAEIGAALRALDGNATVRIESASCLAPAIALFAASPAGFADCLLAVKASQAGCAALCGFDRKMRSLPGVELL